MLGAIEAPRKRCPGLWIAGDESPAYPMKLAQVEEEVFTTVEVEFRGLFEGVLVEAGKFDRRSGEHGFNVGDLEVGRRCLCLRRKSFRNVIE
jgi:hypothetical protein